MEFNHAINQPPGMVSDRLLVRPALRLGRYRAGFRPAPASDVSNESPWRVLRQARERRAAAATDAAPKQSHSWRVGWLSSAVEGAKIAEKNN